MLLDALGLSAGLAAYAYVAGGVVDFLRFTGAGLPAFQALPLLSDRQLLAVGVAVLFLSVPVGCLTAFIHWRLGHREIRRKDSRDRESGPPVNRERLSTSTKVTVESGVMAASISGLVALLLAAVEAADTTGLVSAVGVAGSVGAAFGVGLPLIAAASWKGLSRLPRRLIVVLFLASVLIGGASLAYFEPLRLARAVVRLSNGLCMEGLYLSRDGDSVHFVDGRSRRLLTIEKDDVSGIQVEGSIRVRSAVIATVHCPGLLMPIGKA